MTAKQRAALWGGGALSVAIIALGAIFIIRQMRPGPPVVLTGVILVDDKDPQKQAPIGFAQVDAVAGQQRFTTRGDATGLFRLTLPRSFRSGLPILLHVESAGYRPRNFVVHNPEQIQVLHLASAHPSPVRTVAKPITVSNTVRVRYTEQSSVTTILGSLVKTFEVVNKGNIPCQNHQPCSPDGKWKATLGSAVIEGQGGQFRNVRVSCIAGPCPFTRLESETPVDNGRNLKIAVLNWSDTTTFLVEAEVVQTHPVEVVREAFAAVFGNSMNFSLPATAEGPSIIAEVGGHEIVYPLGPDLLLSWAVCSVKVAGDGTRQFHCDLKPEYRFK